MKTLINKCRKAALVMTGLCACLISNAEGYIYFDLLAGNITITSNTYTGYVYVNGASKKVTGSHNKANNYYVYQSSTVSGSSWTAVDTGYATQADFDAKQNIRIPQYDQMIFDGKPWADYITNNSDVEAVAANWETAAVVAKRTASGNFIRISGSSTFNVVIDNVWSSLCDINEKNSDGNYMTTGRLRGGVSIIGDKEGERTTSKEKVTLALKGDSRMSNILYCNNSTGTGYLHITSFDGDNAESGSITLAFPDGTNISNQKYNNDAIIGCGNSKRVCGGDMYNLCFNGGTVFAGCQKVNSNKYTETNHPIIHVIGARNNSGITFNGGRVTSVSNGTASAIGGGGGYINPGGKGYITINGGEVYAYNHSAYSMEYSEFIPCVAIGGGSGVEMEATKAEVTINGGYVYAQSAGGVAIGGGGSSQAKGGEGIVTINGGEVHAKSISGSLAGKSFPAGASIGGGTGTSGGNATVKISGTDTKVVAGSVGGGKATANKGKYGYANATVNAGDIQAQFVMEKGASSSCNFTMTGGTIHDSNSSSTDYELIKKDGGAIWINDTGGKVDLSNCSIEGCYADNGGAIYQTGGTINIKDNVRIEGNKALSGNGGAIYISGGTANIDSDNAGVTGNEAAKFGGGLYVAGGAVTFSKGNLTGNTALNGGGLYLASGSKMTFKGGIISANNAVASTSATATTAYHGGNGIEGCGGGIYLQSGPDASHKTSLFFDLPSDYRVFGLYTNNADMGGNDLVAEGLNTSIALPAVSDLQLIGFEGVDANPFWYQDYYTGDTGYNQPDGHAVEGTVQTIDRFKNILDLPGTQYYEHRIPDERLSAIKGKYLCLTLSFNMLDIVLTANGLLGHETAMFKLIRHGSINEYNYDILLNVVDGVASRTLKNMPWGTYSVIPNNQWNWEYEPHNPLKNIRVGETNRYEFVFDMNHISAAELPQHDEQQATE